MLQANWLSSERSRAVQNLQGPSLGRVETPLFAVLQAEMAPFREWIYLQMAKRELLTSYWRRCCLKSHWPKGGCSKVSVHFKLWNIILMRAMVPVFLSKEQHGVSQGVISNIL